jgi:hypothetical protein
MTADGPALEPTDDAPPQLGIELPTEQEAGVFADFANIWNTPSTFVLDFLSVKQPLVDAKLLDPEADGQVLLTKVVSRIRIPAEQVFPLIQALSNQAQMWLQQTGREEPPEAWFSPERPSA